MMTHDEKRQDRFLSGFLRCALWTGTDESREDGGEPLDKNYTELDFSADTILAAWLECGEFLAACDRESVPDFSEIILRRPDCDDDGSAGHDFCLTRNGHGAGFWDGDWRKPWDKILTRLSKRAGEFFVYVGDDGKLHGSAA